MANVAGRASPHKRNSHSEAEPGLPPPCLRAFIGELEESAPLVLWVTAPLKSAEQIPRALDDKAGTVPRLRWCALGMACRGGWILGENRERDRIQKIHQR